MYESLVKLVSRVVEPALDMTTQWGASDTFDHKDRCEVEAIKGLGRKVGVGVDVYGVNGGPGAYCSATSINW